MSTWGSYAYYDQQEYKRLFLVIWEGNFPSYFPMCGCSFAPSFSIATLLTLKPIFIYLICGFGQVNIDDGCEFKQVNMQRYASH